MFAEPEELAEAVLFLVSRASDHLSGQNIIFGVPMQPRTFPIKTNVKTN